MVYLIGSDQEILDCATSAVTAQCGEQIGAKIDELGSKLTEACHLHAHKRQTGQLRGVFFLHGATFYHLQAVSAFLL